MFKKAKTYLNNKSEISDLVAILVITFGVVLLVAGLYLLITDATQTAQGDFTGQSVISTISWIPGIPFYLGELVNYSLTAVGLVSWIVGFDFLLLGLGLWVRHKLARLAALAIFLLATCFQFVQFLLLGILGSPIAVIETAINAILLYVMFSKFEIRQKDYVLNANTKQESADSSGNDSAWKTIRIRAD